MISLKATSASARQRQLVSYMCMALALVQELLLQGLVPYWYKIAMRVLEVAELFFSEKFKDKAIFLALKAMLQMEGATALGTSRFILAMRRETLL